MSLRDFLVQRIPQLTPHLDMTGRFSISIRISVECSPGALRAVVRNTSLDPFGKVRTRSHRLLSKELARALHEVIAGRSRLMQPEREDTETNQRSRRDWSRA